MDASFGNLGPIIMPATRSILFAALIACPLMSSAADAAQNPFGFSAFGSVNPSELVGGAILSERGTSPNFDRGINVQTCYVVRTPPEQTIRLLTLWNPVSHKDLEIYSARTFASGDQPQFETLRLDAAAKPVRNLLQDTHKGASDDPPFHSSSGDSALLRKLIPGEAADKNEADSAEFRKLAQNFWSALLSQRYEAFLKGGITSLPAYRLDEQSVPVHGEIISLLSQAPAVQAHFKSLLSEAVFQPASKAPAAPASFYWQVLNSDKTATCALGAIYAREDGDRWQAADYQLYSSHSYLTMITLYELLPFKSGTETHTLVWRGDFVSAPSFSSLRGVEQMAAASLMIKSIKNNIRCFQQDALASKAR